MFRKPSLIEKHIKQNKRGKMSAPRLLMNSQRLFNKESKFLLEDWNQIKQSFGKLSFKDYILFRLYDERYSLEDKKRFLSDRMHWSIVDHCSPLLTEEVLSEDKQKTYDYLSENGIPVPETIGIVNSKKTPYDTQHPLMNSSDDIKEFLTQQDSFPLFAKPNFGIASYGAFVIKSANPEGVSTEDIDHVGYRDLLKTYFSDEVFLLQKSVENHKDLQKFSQYVATIRIANIISQGNQKVHYAVLKIPSANSVADNYWRDGNALAEIDLHSGKLLRAVSGIGEHLRDIEDHPDSGEKIVGFQIPYWRELLVLNEKISALFSHVTYQSLDIAITNDGPLVIEVNRGGSFELPQIVMNQGLLNQDMIDYLTEHNVHIDI